MTTPTIEAPANLSEMFAAAKPEALALPESALVRRQVSPDRVLELTTRIVASWTAIEAQAQALLAPARFAAYQAQAKRLETRAWVFYQAALEVGAIFSDDARRERDELAARVREHDAELSAWARACFRNDTQASETLADIARNHGRRDDADDVLRLVGMFRHGATLGLELPISEARLDAAEADAKQQLELLSAQLGGAARGLAARAYTLWHRDYDQVMALGRFLTRGEANSQALFPGVRMLGSRRRPEAEGELPQSDTAAPTPVDEVEAAVAS